MSALADYTDLITFLAEINAPKMIAKLNSVVNGCPPVPRQADEPDWKHHLEQVQAELAEHLPHEAFTKIAKRPAYQASMDAREGRPAKGPPRMYVGAEKLFQKDLDRTMIPVTRVEKYKDGFIAVIPYHLIDAVTMARNTFEAYAAIHREKHTPDGDAKAALNDDLAKRMNAALAGKPIK